MKEFDEILRTDSGLCKLFSFSFPYQKLQKACHCEMPSEYELLISYLTTV